MYKLLFTIAVLIFLSSCSSDEAPIKVKTIDKTGSVEMKLEVKHLKDKDLLCINYYVWYNNKIVKIRKVYDTVPQLPLTTTVISETVKNNEDEEEETEISKTVSIPKNYQFFVTLK
ncbi:MAG: hypothetical protein Q8880_08280 [Bacteroidota bacterium]|nr:hypothetical protein [Bacteroidota bacterium]